MNSGKTSAKANIHVAAAREIAIFYEDSKTTGASAMADIVHIETTPDLLAIVTTAGNRIGKTNARTTVRRRTSCGHSISAKASRDGRAAKIVRTMGTAR
jgi:hypothetical protein